MPQVTEINTLTELQPYRLLWKSLLGRMRGATFSHSLEWLQAYWRCFGRDRRLRALIVHGAGEPIGILPLVQQTTSNRVGSWRVLTYPLDGRSTTYGPIGPNPTATLVTAMRHLSQCRDWDLLDLAGIRGEVDGGRTQLAMRTAGLRCRQEDWGSTAVIDFTGTWQTYLDQRGPQFREHLSQAERAARGESLSYQRYRPQGSMFADDDPRWELLDECFELDERNRPRSCRGSADRSQCKPDRFLRELHLAAARAGSLDVNLLRWHGRPVAFAYAYHLDGVLQLARMGAAPPYSHLDPASLLLASMVQDSYQRGDRWLDLGTDGLGGKHAWHSRTATSQRCCHHGGTSPRGRLIRLTRWLTTLRRTETAGTCEAS